MFNKIKKLIGIHKIDKVKYTKYPYVMETEDKPRIFCKCPECGGDIVYGSISCPDGREDCLVAHWGYGCVKCCSVFNIEAEYEKPENEKPIVFMEKIGIGIVNPRGINKLGKNV